jgi:CheY-like chemotaxis protein
MSAAEESAARIEVLLVKERPAKSTTHPGRLSRRPWLTDLKRSMDGGEARASRNEEVPACGLSPELILADVHLPRADRCEVPVQIQEDLRLKSIPAVILTLCLPEMDVAKRYRVRGELLSLEASASVMRARAWRKAAMTSG